MVSHGIDDDRVLVIGESLVDIVETQTGERFEAPGGSPLNVAVALSRLGVDTLLLTALGDDDRAARIGAHLEESAVRLVAGSHTLSTTSTAVARTRPDGSAQYEFDVSWAPPVVPTPRVRAVHAGSLALFVEPGDAVVRAHLEAAHPHALVSLDPNIRPSLLPERPAVVERFERLLPLAHVVKLSDEDADWLYPGLDDESVVRRLLDDGPSLVAMTRGAQGCLVACRDACVTVAAPATSVVDTIGAGDSFMGALLHQLLRRELVDDLVSQQGLWPEELEAIGAAATAVAAVTVGRAGADPPWWDELSA